MVEAHRTPDLTVWYDGDCPLCRAEIDLLRHLDEAGRILFVDLSVGLPCPLDRETMKQRFHAQEAGGPLLSGADAFAAMWRAIPPLAPLGEAARRPRLLAVLERAYGVFLKVRPLLQRLLGGYGRRSRRGPAKIGPDLSHHA